MYTKRSGALVSAWSGACGASMFETASEMITVNVIMFAVCKLQQRHSPMIVGLESYVALSVASDVGVAAWRLQQQCSELWTLARPMINRT